MSSKAVCSVGDGRLRWNRCSWEAKHLSVSSVRHTTTVHKEDDADVQHNGKKVTVLASGPVGLETLLPPEECRVMPPGAVAAWALGAAPRCSLLWV